MTSKENEDKGEEVKNSSSVAFKRAGHISDAPAVVSRGSSCPCTPPPSVWQHICCPKMGSWREAETVRPVTIHFHDTRQTGSRRWSVSRRPPAERTAGRMLGWRKVVLRCVHTLATAAATAAAAAAATCATCCGCSGQLSTFHFV